MDKWSTAPTTGKRSVVPLMSHHGKKKHAGSPTLRNTAETSPCDVLPNASASLCHRSSMNETLAASRLQRALGILRRLAKQEEVVTSLEHLEDGNAALLPLPSSSSMVKKIEFTSTKSKKELAPVVVVDGGDNSPPGGETVQQDSALRSLEAELRFSVTNWISRLNEKRLRIGTEGEGDHFSIADDEDIEEEESPDAYVHRIIEQGVSLDLSRCGLQVHHLPAAIEFIHASCCVAPPGVATEALLPLSQQEMRKNRKSGVRDSSSSVRGTATQHMPLRVPLRAVNLTALSTPVSLATQTFTHLSSLLSCISSIVVLELGPHCYIEELHCQQLQLLLERNLSLLRTARRREERRKEIRARKLLRRDGDDWMDFFFWENSERFAMYELENRLRKEVRVAMIEAERTTLRKAQEQFTRQRLAAQRRELLLHAEASLGDVFSQSCHTLVRHQLKFLQLLETKQRTVILAHMSVSLDGILTQHKLHQTKHMEKYKVLSSTKRDAVTELFVAEQKARVQIHGQYSALALMASLVLHYRLKHGNNTHHHHDVATFQEARAHHFIGLLSRPWQFASALVSTEDALTSSRVSEASANGSPRSENGSPRSECSATSATLYRRQNSFTNNVHRVENVALAVLNAEKAHRANQHRQLGHPDSPLASNRQAGASPGRSFSPVIESPPPAQRDGPQEDSGSHDVTLHDEDLPPPNNEEVGLFLSSSAPPAEDEKAGAIEQGEQAAEEEELDVR